MDLRTTLRRILKRTKSGKEPQAGPDAVTGTASPNTDQASLATSRSTTSTSDKNILTEKPLPPLQAEDIAVDDTDDKSEETLADRVEDRRCSGAAKAEHLGPSQAQHDLAQRQKQPLLVVSEPSPAADNVLASATSVTPPPETVAASSEQSVTDRPTFLDLPQGDRRESQSSTAAVSPGSHLATAPPRPADTTTRQQSLFTGITTATASALLEPNAHIPPNTRTTPVTEQSAGHTGIARQLPANMNRKIWVKRPGASATMVTIKEDDLVDDVRDMILRKYANSLGRSFDSPDVTLHIITRPDNQRHQQEKILGPELEMCRTLDTYYPGGQSVDEALVIDVPGKPSPRTTPRRDTHASYRALDDYRPQESGTDYFPPMPAIAPPVMQNSNVHEQRPSQSHHHTLHLPDQTRALSVLATGQVPPLPSPGVSVRHRRDVREHRPRIGRQQTSSPTIVSHSSNAGGAPSVAPSNLGASQHLAHRPSVRARGDSTASDRANGIPPAPPLPTPPAPEAPPTSKTASTPPTPMARDHSSLRPSQRPRRSRKATPTNIGSAAKASSALPASLLDGSVPPINVLIVEDNVINLRLLEAFMKRLKVRWSTAMNGQIAVNKWRAGGFHLVLMDIQMPIMNGLEATKEIRRLERVNGIGVFSNSSPTSPAQNGKHKSIKGSINGQMLDGEEAEDQVAVDRNRDKLGGEEDLFKSPVIIVALTASSLQSDRHEALAAGCNDFLTKPVSFVWLERKVKEWGCMQALIDFDGWRKWKDFGSPNGDTAASADAAAKAKEKKVKRVSRASADGNTVAGGKRVASDEVPPAAIADAA